MDLLSESMGGARRNSGPAPHDLLRLVDGEVATLAHAAPEWVKTALAAAPYAVVRRECAAPGMVAVGVRGSTRAERYGSYLARRDDCVPITPEALAQAGAWRAPLYGKRVPALEALDRVAGCLARAGWRWGPCGSVGFELATGRPTATAASDLDIVVQCPERLERSRAAEMVEALAECGCRIDVILETPAGGVALRDWAGSTDGFLARTPRGAMLVADPWVIAVQAPVCP